MLICSRNTKEIKTIYFLSLEFFGNVKSYMKNKINNNTKNCVWDNSEKLSQ